MTLLELLRYVNVLQVTSDLILSITGKRTQVTLELLDHEVFLADMKS